MTKQTARERSDVPAYVDTEAQLDDLLSTPSERLVRELAGLDGDITILGIAGKLGVTLGSLAVRALRAAGSDKRVIGVSRFSNAAAQEQCEAAGMETIPCDLLDRAAVAALPRVQNVICMAGRKFGTQDNADLTWAMNTIVPANVAEHFEKSRIVAFSTGCVYPLVDQTHGGSTEADALGAVGEYAQSCVGRERVLSHYSRVNGTPTCLFRLNYAVDLRYGVLSDIAQQILSNQPVNDSAPFFNCIWQGDANERALLALTQCHAPAVPLNVTGTEVLGTRDVAKTLATLLGRNVTFQGHAENHCYLNDASRSFALWGPPQIAADVLIRWQAHWLQIGGRTLDSPTHFEITNGCF